MATIRDVAALAGVSATTVSRVLNGNYPVKAETRQVVESAIKKLNFHPSIIGRNLSIHNKKTILVVTSTTISEMYMQALNGIDDTLSSAGYDFLMTIVNSSTSSWERCAQYIRGGLVGGVVLLSRQVIDMAANAAPLDVPVVQCSESPFPKFPNCISYDNRRAAYELTCRLIAQGYRRFGFILSKKASEETPSEFSAERLEGMKRALAENSLPYEPELTTLCPQQLDLHRSNANVNAATTETAEFYLRLPPEKRPDVIICTYDAIATACISVLQRGGLRIPLDIAVAGFDNSSVAMLTCPQLTSVQPPSYEMGVESAKLLISLMCGERSDGFVIQLPYQIFERGSTNAALN